MELDPQSNVLDSLTNLRERSLAYCADLSALMHSAGVDPGRTRWTARQLGVSPNVIWRIAKVIASNDMLTNARELPGRAAMDPVLSACRERGVSEEIIEAVNASLVAYHEAVIRDFGSRRALVLLLSGSEGEDITARQEKSRRQFFEGGCAIWGVQARVRLNQIFVTPGERNPELLDVAAIPGYIGLRRFRCHPWPLAIIGQLDPLQQPFPTDPEPLDPEAETVDGLPLLQEFCSKPLPELRSSELDGCRRYDWVGELGGPDTEFDLFYGLRIRNRFRSREHMRESGINLSTTLTTPVERVIVDCHIHRSVNVALPPTVQLMDRMAAQAPGDGDSSFEQTALPISESPREIGDLPNGAMTTHAPMLPRLLERAFDLIGHSADEFRSYRFEMSYPPYPAVLVFRCRPLD